GGSGSGHTGPVAGATSPAAATLPAGPASGDKATGTGGGTGTDGDGADGRAAGRRAAVVATLGRAVRTHLGRLRGATREAATREVADLANRLPAGVRATLFQAALRVLASQDEAAQALRTLVADQPPGDVLAALRHLAAERVQLSPSALRLAQQLTAALRARQEAAAPADPAVYGAMRELFRDVDIDRIAPPGPTAEDRRGIIEMPAVTPFAPGELPDLGPRRDTLADDYVTRQLASTLLELIAGALPERAPDEATLWRLEDLYRGFLLAGRIHQATEVVESLRTILQQARSAGAADGELRRCIERLANREAVAALLQALPQLSPDAADAARRLIVTLGTVAVRHLVAALSEETDRSRRHQLLGLLSSLGPAVVPSATLLLGDARWYVVRNMILLLRTVGDQTSVPQLRRCAEHPDLRVRLEAIKSLFASDSEVPDELLTKAIEDPNPKMAEAAIALVGAYGITQAVPPLVALLRRLDFFGRRRVVRVRALKTLGRLADPAALPRLEPIFKERLIRLVASEERVAAFAALASYPEDARQPLLARGLRSRDPAVRAVCERLRAGGVAALDETHV
ncbi:MAG TPA: HEAT repeat domain-containing protein, partial [Thermoanaerobaculia bacterium]|nr:HEAT repeat domain-containing protein [Thermoanaerobaculia bacterium]